MPETGILHLPQEREPKSSIKVRLEYPSRADMCVSCHLKGGIDTNHIELVSLDL